MDSIVGLLPARIAEARALEVARRLPGEKILCTTLGRAQAAVALARERPSAEAVCWFLDQYQQSLCRAPDVPSNLFLICQADFPEQDYDLIVLPISMHGEAELARDLLQSAALRLNSRGNLVAASDNPRDSWLRNQLARLFGGIQPTVFPDATVYAVSQPLSSRKRKQFTCEFAFRDRGYLLRAVSRPGVFSHRHVDPGARQLLSVAEVRQDMRILEIGCGSGCVSLGLAARQPTVRVHAVDSNARAIECIVAGAKLNDLANVTTELNASGEYADPGTFDLAVANPPYYSEFAIAERFVSAAHRSLRPGGQLLLVTKHPLWYEEHVPQRWQKLKVTASKRYFVVSAKR